MTRQATNLDYNETQQLDLFLVEQPGQPLIVSLHGGGFFAGSKDDERCSQAATFLTRAGFNYASISYSLGSRKNRFAMWPRNLFDLADALAFLHDHATDYNYDFGRLGMLGFSAGCCLSNLYITFTVISATRLRFSSLQPWLASTALTTFRSDKRNAVRMTR